MIPTGVEMNPCVIKKFKTAITSSTPGSFNLKCGLEFGSRITKKYQITAMNRSIRSRLTYRQRTKNFYDRFIRLLLQNRFTNQIRLPAIGIHFTAIFHSHQLTSEAHQFNDRSMLLNSIVPFWRLNRMPAHFFQPNYAKPADFKRPDSANILHRPFLSLLQRLLQMRLESDHPEIPQLKISSGHPPAYGHAALLPVTKRNRFIETLLDEVPSISVLIKTRLSEWHAGIDAIINRGLISLKSNLAEYSQRFAPALQIKPASLNFRTSYPGRFDIRKTPLMSLFGSGRMPQLSGFLNQLQQYLNRFLIVKRFHSDATQQSIWTSTEGLPWIPQAAAQGPPSASSAGAGGMHPTLRRNTMSRHVQVQPDFPASSGDGVRQDLSGAFEARNTTQILSKLRHLILQPFRHWPNRLTGSAGHQTFHPPREKDDNSLKAPAALTDKRIRYFVDASHRGNAYPPVFQPPKMKLAVPEKNAVPDLRGELQSVERQLKNLKPTDSRPPFKNLDIHHLTEKVYDEIERKLRIERERRGL